jgi:hypothetical protein
MICPAIPAAHRGHSRKDPGRDTDARETPKRNLFQKKQWTLQECNSGIKGRGARHQIRQRKKRTTYMIFRKFIKLQTEKREVGIRVGNGK